LGQTGLAKKKAARVGCGPGAGSPRETSSFRTRVGDIMEARKSGVCLTAGLIVYLADVLFNARVAETAYICLPTADSCVHGLGVTNRMDTLLLFGPALALALGRRPGPRALGEVLLGMVPFLAWEVFAVVYYGFPFPNTAYAKLGAGIPAATLAGQGLRYVGN